MEIITGFFGNYPLMCAIIAYFIAQILKIIICVIKEKRFDIGLIVSSGGMPSSHSATVSALAIAIAKSIGVNSAEFAISFILASVVMYDAAGVRRAAGEQAKLINQLVKEVMAGETETASESLKELIGHTPIQVLAGSILGIIIPFIYNIQI